MTVIIITVELELHNIRCVQITVQLIIDTSKQLYRLRKEKPLKLMFRHTCAKNFDLKITPPLYSIHAVFYLL